MTEVQSPPIARPKQKVGSLDGFLACGGKRTDADAEASPESIILDACGDVNIDVLLTAAKADQLATSTGKKGKPRCRSTKPKESQPSAQAQSKTEGNRPRSSDGRTKPASLAQSCVDKDETVTASPKRTRLRQKLAPITEKNPDADRSWDAANPLMDTEMPRRLSDFFATVLAEQGPPIASQPGRNRNEPTVWARKKPCN